MDSKDQKRSLSDIRQIKARKWVLSSSRGRGIQDVVQVYKVTGSHEWYPLSDLAPRIKNEGEIYIDK